MITGIDFNWLSDFSFVSISTPPMTGIVISRRMMSGVVLAAIANPSTPFWASSISQANDLKAFLTIIRTVFESSTVRILMLIVYAKSYRGPLHGTI